MFLDVAHVYIPPVLLGVLSAGAAIILVAMVAQVSAKRDAVAKYKAGLAVADSQRLLTEKDRLITNRSI